MSSPPQVGVRPLQMNTQASMSGSQARTRTRGPNKCIALNHQRERVVLRVNEHGQPIGANAHLLSSFLGMIARDGQKTPINYFDWRKMPVERKTDMWQAVLSRFEIATDEQQRVKKWVLSKICQNWKNWKSNLKKKHYDPFHTTRERLQYRPNRVDPMPWALLIEFWGTEDGTERSKRNVENRAMQTMNHTAGTKSFARIREEERERNPDGQVPDRMEMFRLTHTCRNGQPVDRASEDTLRRLNERVSQQPESSERSCARDDIFTQVMGEDRRSRVRTFGMGVTPSDIYGPRVSVAEAREIANAERAQRIVAEQRVVSIEERMGRMEARMHQMMTCYQMFAQYGQPSSFEPVFSAPPVIKRDV